MITADLCIAPGDHSAALLLPIHISSDTKRLATPTEDDD